jgi:RNA polymerase sigma-32 factor
LRQLFAEKLQQFRLTLAGRDLEIFEQRMLAEKPLTLREIGQKYNISAERVRQIEEEILAKAREFLQQEIPDFDTYKGDMLNPPD